jgi:hypothetical protein
MQLNLHMKSLLQFILFDMLPNTQYELRIYRSLTTLT